MNWICMVTAMAALSGVGAAKAPSEAIYTLTPELRDGALQALDVTIRLPADATGITHLQLPDSDGGASDLWRHLQDLHIEGASAVAEDGPAKRVVRSAPSAPLTLRYRVVSAFDHDPGSDDLNPYKPAIRPRWFWAYGEALFIHPDGGDRRARFVWTGAPNDFPFASNLEHAGGGALSMDDLLQSVAVGGPDLSVFRRDAAGAPVRIAEIGRYGFDGSAFADMAARVIEGERRFWGGREGPFLVALGPLTPAPNVRSSRGEGRGDAFAVMTTTDIPLNFMKAMLAHEYFHTWNLQRLGGMADGEQERAAYWFSEGFTDFYARRLLLRMGVYSPEEFAVAWNEKLRAYAASPVGDAPNSRIVKDFWRDPDVGALPYQRGAILAAIFDLKLRTLSGGRLSLDDVMRAMRDRALAKGPKSPKAPDLFVEVAKTFGLDADPEIAAVVEKGGPVHLPDNAFGACLPVRTVTAPAFDRGFDAEASLHDHALSGVKSDSPAYAAGLRDGMALVKLIGGVYGDSRAPYKVVVKDGGAARTIAYRPEGRTMITFQEIAPKAVTTDSERTTCLRAAAGGPPITAD